MISMALCVAFVTGAVLGAPVDWAFSGQDRSSLCAVEQEMPAKARLPLLAEDILVLDEAHALEFFLPALESGLAKHCWQERQQSNGPTVGQKKTLDVLSINPSPDLQSFLP